MQDGDFQSLFKHMEWADALIWKVVGELDEPQRGGRLGELLHHLHSVEWAYLQVWRGGRSRFRN